METLATYVRQLRERRNASLSSVAREAAISKSTLWSWEAGACLPCVPELVRVLDVLGANNEERMQAFALLDAPRGYRLVRECTGLRVTDAQSLLGGLLRAMRLRKGRTQADVAAAVRVDRATVARWEDGERRANAAETDFVCEALGAFPLEREALHSGRHALPLLESALFLPGQSHLDHMFDTAYRLQTSADVAMRGIRYATLLMALAADCAQGREPPATLALGLTLHAEELIRSGDYMLALARLQAAESVVGERNVTRLAPRVVPLTAEVHAGRGGAGVRRALQLLDGHIADIASQGARSWAAANRALMLAMVGEPGAAARDIEDAVGYAQASENLYEVWHRDEDRIRWLLASGRFADAGAAFLTRFRLNDVNCAIRDLALQADVLAANGELERAQASLDAARCLATETQRAHLLHAAASACGGIRPRLRARYARTRPFGTA